MTLVATLNVMLLVGIFTRQIVQNPAPTVGVDAFLLTWCLSLFMSCFYLGLR